MNPELRQTFQNLSRNLESANEAAQERIYTFTELYIDPCLTGFKSCLNDCTAPCFQGREDHLRRKRGRSRGRDELDFDFYDNWDDEDDAAQNLLGWGSDDLDTVLAGNQKQQPQRQRAMSYGSRGRIKDINQPSDSEPDPTVIRGSAYLGFLERLPFNLGSKSLRYKPSAAGLQENPGGVRVRDHETDILINASDDEARSNRARKHGRERSGTTASRSTNNSLSSRGDLILSDEEDDAVPLDDEFAINLGRRTTNTGSEDQSSGKGSSKRPGASRASTTTASSKSIKTSKSRRSSSKKSLEPIKASVDESVDPPTMVDLRNEEEQMRIEQEMEVEQKREAAQKLAEDKGLSSPGSKTPVSDTKSESTIEDFPPITEVLPEPEQVEEEVAEEDASSPREVDSGKDPGPPPGERAG